MINISDYTGRFCMINNHKADADALREVVTASATLCYEVIRVVDGVFLFLEDHLRRLRDSIKRSYKIYNIDYESIKETLLKLQINNKLVTGNIKLLFSSGHDKTLNPLFIAYQIVHHYPGEREIMSGIKTSLFTMERESPNLKLIRTSQQDKCREALINRKVYELLLVDQQEFVTEGSKSNLFLIREGSVFTPPSGRVLKGITREKVIAVCHHLNLSLSEENIPAGSLHLFDAAFITGTSPKVLPIASVDAVAFDAKHPLIRDIRDQYETLIKNYITAVKREGYSWQ